MAQFIAKLLYPIYREIQKLYFKENKDAYSMSCSYPVSDETNNTIFA